MTNQASNAAYFLRRPSVGQSFGFASGLPPGPELAFPPMNRHKFLAIRVGRNALTPKGDSMADGGAEAPALQGI